jgi:hypothetical protein
LTFKYLTLHRHLASIAALTIIGVTLGFDIFTQQMVDFPTEYLNDSPPLQIYPYQEDVREFEAAYRHDQSTPLPDSLQYARIANTTIYDDWDTLGETPCKCFVGS